MMRLTIRTLYNLLLLLLLPLLLVFHGYRSARRGRRCAFAERFGAIAGEDLALISGGGVIWVHAVSVGETIASFPLLKGVRARYPGHRIVISNVTETGRSVAQKCGLADLCIYLPFDYRFAVRAALDHVRPELIVIMETELWPNFIHEAHARGIPVVLANGRISDRSFPRYQRFGWFFRPMLQELAALCMQSAEDARRIRAIGAPEPAVHVVRNLKFDVPVQPPAAGLMPQMRARYRVPADCLVFTAGSTHAGEEQAVIAAYRTLLSERKDLFMILAPRHPERCPEVGGLLALAGLPFVLRSTLAEGQAALPPGGVLLVDTVGELVTLYGVSDLVFVGGSLVPTGGHNVLEPAALGVAVLFGPHMMNFREIAALVLSARAGVQVEDGAGLTEALRSMVADGASRRATGLRGAALVEENSGSTKRHLAVIESCFDGQHAP